MAEHSAHEPPGLPQITDEAADTPMWVPVLGLALLALLSLFFVYATVGSSDETDEVAPVDTALAAPGDAPSAE